MNARPRGLDPGHLGLVEHHLGDEHGPAVARLAPRQVVAAVARVPDRSDAAGPCDLLADGDRDRSALGQLAAGRVLVDDDATDQPGAA